MRKIYITILSVFSFLFVTKQLDAQVNVGNYIFIPTTAPYVPLAGGTVSTASGDDGQQNVPLGFSFTFGGVAYTNAIITTNGVIQLTNDAAATFTQSWVNELSDEYGLPVIAALWDDHSAPTGETTISYLTTGTAPARTFTVEWTDLSVGFSDPGTFKITLREGSNQVSISYGSIVLNEFLFASIGLGDLTSFLSVNPGPPATASNTVSTGVESTQPLASGVTYNFFPPSPCIPGSLTGGTTSTASASVCAATDFTLNVTGSSTGSGIVFEWQSSTDGTTWTALPTSNTQTYTTTQTGPTYYRRKITCGPTSQFSSSLLVGMNNWIDCYCNADLTTFVNTGDIVTRVLLTNASGGTLNQPSTSNGTTNYEQYANTPLDLSKSTTSTLAITFGTDGNQRSAAWIDYNHDGAFDASENIALSTGPTPGGGTATYTFTVPASALLGNTRMRVRGGSDNNYTADGACDPSNYGETEDYLVNIVPPPPCVAPLAPTGVASSPTAATISWTAPTPAPGTGYEWEVRTTGAAGSGATGLAASGTTGTAVVTVNVTGLTANTGYSVYVRSVCTAGSLYSTWSLPGQFRTPCVAITTFPFTETFEDNSPTRDCWNPSDYVDGNIDWVYAGGPGPFYFDDAAHTGVLNAQFFINNRDGNKTRLVSPALNLSSMTTTGARLTFWYKLPNWAGDQNELRVFYKTSIGGTWTQIPAAEYTEDVREWTRVRIALPNPSADYYVAFEGTALYGYGDAVDDVSITPFPTCPEVENITATGISSTSVQVNFTSPGAAFIVEYGAPGFTPGTASTAGVGGTVVLGGSSPIRVNGLAAETTYDFYVRRVCTPGVDYGTNEMATASTLCAPVNVPYLQDFTTASTPDVPTCTSVQDLNGASTWQTYDFAPANWGFNGTTLRYLFDLDSVANDWFYIQGLNLTAGTTYQLSYKYGSTDPLYSEAMKVAIGNAATNTAMTTTLIDHPSIVPDDENPPFAKLDRISFTVPTSGVYYIGFQAYSDADNYQLLLDSINVKVLPVVDLGVIGTANVLPTCPVDPTAIVANVYNYNLTANDFAVHPVTVTATISGDASGTVSTVVNSGTLAAGDTLAVTLPVFPFNAGNYTIVVSTSSVGDSETANDSYTTPLLVNPTPTAPVITATAPSVCEGAITTLNATSTGQLNQSFGNNGGQTSLTDYPSPYSAFYGGQKMQMLVTAAELTAQGFTAGSPIQAISFNVISRGSNWGSSITSDNSFRVSIGATALTSLTAFQTGLTVVVPAANYTPVVGFENNHVFNTPFTWNGTSNLIVETTFSNNFFGGSQDGMVMSYTATSFPSTVTYRADNTSPAVIAAATTVSVTSSNRPDFKLRTFGSLPITWSPVTGLFSDAAATVPYVAGSITQTVYAKPASTTVYNAIATSSVGCPASSPFTVTVNPLPVVTIAALPARICLSDELIPLTATPAGGTWSGIGISGNNFAPINTALGTYNLRYTYTSPQGCTSSATIAATVVDCPERRVLLRDDAVVLYPNPNDGRFNIRINSVLYNRLSMKVYTAGGAVARTQEFSGLAYGRVIPVDLTTLPSGVYLVHFYYNAGAAYSDKTFKVVVGR